MGGFHYQNTPIYCNFSSAVKIENFQLKNFDIFTKNINCGYRLELSRRGSSNEYPQSMFWSKKKDKK